MKPRWILVGCGLSLATAIAACATAEPTPEAPLADAAAPDGASEVRDSGPAPQDARVERDTSLTVSDLVDAMVNRTCTALRDSCAAIGRPIEASKCRKTPPLSRLGELLAVAASKNVEVDPTRAPAECLSVVEAWAKGSFGTTTVVDRNVDLACLSILRGKLAIGATGCTTSLECAQGFCDAASGTGTCRALRAAGETCSDPQRTNEPCARLGIRGADFFCAGGTAGTCVLTKPLGADCANHHECLTGTCAPCGSGGPAGGVTSCDAGASTCAFERTEPLPCDRYATTSADAGAADAGDGG